MKLGLEFGPNPGLKGAEKMTTGSKRHTELICGLILAGGNSSLFGLVLEGIGTIHVNAVVSLGLMFGSQRSEELRKIRDLLRPVGL